jgi:hypothetical protein
MRNSRQLSGAWAETVKKSPSLRAVRCRRFFKRLLPAVTLFGFAWGTLLRAQDASPRWLEVVLPNDSPVLFVSSSWGRSEARVRGMSMALDLHSSLLLRNTGTKTIAALTLRVEAQDLTPSGRGSVTVPSLSVRPGEIFPVRIDMELLRPFNSPAAKGAMVQVALDCALFSDLTAYGPDRLGSRRMLTVYEMQARRDRTYLAKLVQSGRWSEIREELDFGLKDLNPRQFGLELLRDPRSSSSGRSMSIQPVSFPNAPVTALSGAARVTGNEIRAPEIEIRNGSKKLVRNLDMGWIIRDEQGRDYVAGSTPAAVQLAPVQAESVREPATLRFSRPQGQPMLIQGLMAFVNDVEFGDGTVWIPSRSDIQAATENVSLRRALATSPEQQRLADIFRKRGMNGLVEELKRFD